MKKNKINIAFYVSGKATRILKILKLYPQIVKSTVLIFNDSGNNNILHDTCEKLEIDYIEIDYKKLNLKGKEKNNFLSNKLLKNFKKRRVNYGFSFGGKLLVGDILFEYKNKLINFHPSILPHFPGINSIDRALAGKVNLLGNTAHFIDEGVDTGPIIMQSVIHKSKFVDYDSILDLQLPMIDQIFKWLIEERINVNNGEVKIINSDIKINFIPNLEIGE